VAASAAPAAGASPPPALEPEPPRYADYLTALDKANETEAATEDNIEGPFYRPNAPLRNKLHDKGEKGVVLVIAGKVVSRNGRPLAGAMLEVWQATADGRYDNDDPARPPKKDEFRLRGRLRTDDEGNYQFETIRPAPYQVGPAQYRPAHIHIKVHHEGHKSLTTQLYFKDDKYNKTDPWFKPSLVVEYQQDEKDKNRFLGTFKFVLAKA
jgi:catechol 1,2-dioxygenase